MIKTGITPTAFDAIAACRTGWRCALTTRWLNTIGLVLGGWHRRRAAPAHFACLAPRRARVCSMAPIPDEADEDARRCVRERAELLSERVGLTNRIGAVLATLGVNDYNPLLQSRRRRLAELRTGLGEPIPANALAKIERLLTRLELVLAQIAELERERDEVAAADAPDRAGKMIQQLASLRGIGVQSATVLVREAFVRHFSNGKALGSYAGLTSTPYSRAEESTASRALGRQATAGSER